MDPPGKLDGGCLNLYLLRALTVMMQTTRSSVYSVGPVRLQLTNLNYRSQINSRQTGASPRQGLLVD
jgi:hypothetical protein